MSKNIVVNFEDAGVPKTGLSPTIDIIKISDSSLLVNDGALTEIGGGNYLYAFSSDGIEKLRLDGIELVHWETS